MNATGGRRQWDGAVECIRSFGTGVLLPVILHLTVGVEAARAAVPRAVLLVLGGTARWFTGQQTK